ncbi:MAG TPA: AraC family transcriptional regulator [Alcaligenes sp.]|nr:AraC family transcriptional regulator [Alcaligenes sp.]HRL26612.1 AraC family transcriptional regulator [Alcaligenes sp.]
MQAWFMSGLAPLQRSAPRFQSHCPDQTRSETAGVLTEHRLTWNGGQVDASLRYAKSHSFSFVLLKYGAAVQVSPGALEDFLLFQVPIQGHSCIRVGRERVRADPNTASVISPSLPLELDWEQGCEQFLIKIPRVRLEEVARTQLGLTLDKPIEFAATLALDSPQGRAWQHQVGSLLAYGSEPPPELDSWLRQVEDNLLLHLFHTQPGNYSRQLHLGGAPAGSRRVQRAEDFMRAHLDQALTLDDIAQAACVSVRSLTQAFRSERGQSPMQFLKQLRLEAAHAALQHAAPDALVGDLALRVGFNHLGRFCADYKMRFGCTPSQTLNG